MKRTLVLAAALLLALGLMAGVALAHHGDEDRPPKNPHTDGATQDDWGVIAHGHVLLLRPEFVDMDLGAGTITIDFRRCVDIAAGKALPNPNQHNSLHMGTAGASLFDKAGHAVVPTSPLTPFANCEELGEPPVTLPLPPE